MGHTQCKIYNFNGPSVIIFSADVVKVCADKKFTKLT